MRLKAVAATVALTIVAAGCGGGGYVPPTAQATTACREHQGVRQIVWESDPEGVARGIVAVVCRDGVVRP